MKQTLILISVIIFTLQLEAQNLEAEMLYPDTLRSTTDSFYLVSPGFEGVWPLSISARDTLNLGTSGYKGARLTIYTDLDTVEIPHVNFPYRQYIAVPIVSLEDTVHCILRFQGNGSNYSDEYVLEAKGNYSIEIPEVYELANIALYLSECSEMTGNHPNTEYSKRVSEYFAPFRDHTLIKVLNKNTTQSNFWSIYYGFRENSFCFNLDEDDFLKYETPYKHVFYDKTYMDGGHFRNMLYLVQDFMAKSNFREFYRENRNYYNELIERQDELLPIQQMWSWVEKEFPQRYDSYKVVFSSLIDGSHSTQTFKKGYHENPEFKECVMFVNSSEQIDAKENYSEEFKEGVTSAIVFTEIDHNYVNPSSRENIAVIRDLMADKDFWASEKAQVNYSNEYGIFNEYMTHALFCLYVQETYEGDVQEDLIEDRISLMSRRGFLKFEQFNTIFLTMMNNTEKTVYERYPELIEAMNKIM